MMNFSNDTKATVVKETARTEVMTKVIDFLKETYGEENVSIVGINEPAVAIGTWNGNEVCLSISATSKEIENKETSKTTKVAYDRTAAAQAYIADRLEKKANEEKRKAEREAKKAEKEANKD